MWWFLMCSGILSNSLFRCERLKICVSGLSPWHSGPRCSPVQTQVHVFTTAESQGGSRHARHTCVCTSPRDAAHSQAAVHTDTGCCSNRSDNSPTPEQRQRGI